MYRPDLDQLIREDVMKAEAKAAAEVREAAKAAEKAKQGSLFSNAP